MFVFGAAATVIVCPLRDTDGGVIVAVFAFSVTSAIFWVSIVVCCGNINL